MLSDVYRDDSAKNQRNKGRYIYDASCNNNNIRKPFLFLLHALLHTYTALFSLILALSSIHLLNACIL